MTRIVVDVKVWVFYLLTGDQAVARLLKLIGDNKAVNLLSKNLLDKLTKLLSKNQIDNKLKISLAQELTAFLIGKSQFVQTTSTTKGKASKNDIEYVDLAIDGKSAYLITLEMERFAKVDGYKGINAIELESFLENFEN